MPDQDAYAAGLATQLRDRPDLLRAAEDELQQLRGSMRKVTTFLHDPRVALDIRQGLAQSLHLPTPEK